MTEADKITERKQRTEVVPYGEAKGKRRGRGELRDSPSRCRQGGQQAPSSKTHHSAGTGPATNGSAGWGRQLGEKEEK